jgi:hypothetical protein
MCGLQPKVALFQRKGGCVDICGDVVVCMIGEQG